MNKLSTQNVFQTTNVSDYLTNLRSLEFYFDRIQKECSFEVKVQFLEQFFSEYPLSKSLLFPIYFKSMVKWGDPRLALEISRIFVEAGNKVAAVGTSLYNLPLINESNLFLSRFGELFDQGASTYLQTQLGSLQSKPILTIPPIILKCMNTATIPYLQDCYEVVMDEREIKYFMKNANYSPYTGFLYRYSNTQYGHNSYFSLDCYQDLVANDINPYSFKLKDITISKAEQFLKHFNIKLTDKFILLHLREEGYVDADHHTYRNANPQLYIDAVKYFLSQGFKVIRIGHNKMTHMFNQTGFIDLTQVDTPGEVDIFLAGNAQFYFGSASGPSSTSHNFGVPCSLIGLISQGVRSNNFGQFMKLKDTSTGKILTFNDIDKLNLKDITARQPLNDRSLRPIIQDSDANMKFARETLEYFNKGSVFELNKKYEFQRYKHRILGGLCTSSLSLLN